MAGNDGNPDRGTAPFDGESHPFRVSGARFSRANGLERALPLLRQACGQPVNPVFLQFDDFVFGFDHATGHFQQVGRSLFGSVRPYDFALAPYQPFQRNFRICGDKFRQSILGNPGRTLQGTPGYTGFTVKFSLANRQIFNIIQNSILNWRNISSFFLHNGEIIRIIAVLLHPFLFVGEAGHAKIRPCSLVAINRIKIYIFN